MRATVPRSLDCGRQSSSTKRSCVIVYSWTVVCVSLRTLSTHAVVQGRGGGDEPEHSTKSAADMTSTVQTKH